MNKNKKNRKGFTIVELVIVIAVIGILATVLVPTFGDVIKDAKEKALMQEAKNAYTVYVTEHAEDGTVAETVYYAAGTNKWVTVENGKPGEVVTSTPAGTIIDKDGKCGCTAVCNPTPAA